MRAGRPFRARLAACSLSLALLTSGIAAPAAAAARAAVPYVGGATSSVASAAQPPTKAATTNAIPGNQYYTDFADLPIVDDPATVERPLFRIYPAGEQGAGGSWCQGGSQPVDTTWGCILLSGQLNNTYYSMAYVGEANAEGQAVVPLDWSSPFSVRVYAGYHQLNEIQIAACRFRANGSRTYCSERVGNPAPQNTNEFEYGYITSPVFDADDPDAPNIGFEVYGIWSPTIARVWMNSEDAPPPPGYLPRGLAPDGTEFNPPDGNAGQGGDPVNTFTGAFGDTHVDVAIAGRGPAVTFARSYNSNDTRVGPLGPGWTHSYNMRITAPGDGSDDAILTGPQGRSDRYVRAGGLFEPPKGVHRTLVRNPDDTYTATDKARSVWIFSRYGYLTELRDRYGNSSTITYSGGLVSTIADPAGRGVLTLGYTNGFVTSVTDWASPTRVVAYGYDGSGRLETVTDREGKITTYTYDGSTSRIATITDAGNHVALTTTYDGQGRAATQKDARGLTTGDVTTFDYVVNQDGTRVTTLTLPGTSFEPSFNPTLVDTYDANGWLTTRVTRPTSTETFTQSFTYDVEGDRASVTDPRGNRTDFCYDVNYSGGSVAGSQGNLTRRIDPAPSSGANRPVTLLSYDVSNNLTQAIGPKGVPSGQTVSCATDLSAITSSYATDYAYDLQGTTLLAKTTRFTDPDTGLKSAITKYEYADAANPGLITKVIPPRGNTTPTPDYTYATTLSYFATGSKAGLLKDVTDPLGNKTSYDYDSIGRLTATVDPVGNAAGGIPSEHTTAFSYDKEDRIRFETLPAPTPGGAALVTETRYGPVGKPITAIDANGQVTTFSYDARNSLLQVKESASAWTDPANPPGSVITTEYGYDAGGNVTRVTRAKGDAQYERAVDYVYDGRGVGRRETQYPAWPATTPSLVTASTYDANGNQLTLVDPLSKTATFGYDALDRLTSVDYSDPATADVSYTYDAAGSRTSMTDGTGATAYSYDETGRLLLVTSPGPKAVGYRYDLDSNRTKLIYPDATAATYSWNKAEQLTSLSDWASRSVSYTYWPDGLVRTATNPDSSIATYTYDNVRRLTDLLHQVASTTIARHTYQLDAVGNVTSLNDVAAGVAPHFSAASAVNDVVTNDQIRPSAITGSDGAIYAAWADARSGDNDIYFSKRDPATGTWSASQRVNNITTGSQTQPVIAVDGSGNVYALWADTRAGAADDDIYYSKRAVSTGVWTTSVRVNDDSVGKHQNDPSIAISGTGEVIGAWYDERTNKKNIYSSRLPAGGSTWSANIKVTSDANAVKAEPEVAIGSNGVTYAAWRDHRNGNADIWFATLASGGSSWSTNTKISDDPGTTSQDAPDIGVDTAGNLTVVWNDGRTSPSQIRSGRRLAGNSNWNTSVALGGSQANMPSISVRPDGRAYVTWYNGAPGSLTTLWGSEYDAGANSWSTPERFTDIAEESANPVVTFTTAQLTVLYQRKPSGGNYDIYAKRKVLAGDAYAYAYDRLNHLTSVSGVDGPIAYTYDPAGNRLTRVSGPTTTYTYDRADRITTAGAISITVDANGNTIAKGPDSFAYDQEDRLKSATTSGTTETYVYDGDGTRFSRQIGSNPVTRYVDDVGASLVATIDDGTRKYVFGQGLAYSVSGTAVEVVHADKLDSTRVLTSGSGAVIASYRTDEWGMPAGSSGTSANPFRFTGEPMDGTGLLYLRSRYYDPSLGRFTTRDTWTGSIATPQTLNRYAYVGNNPATHRDPSGHCFIDTFADVAFVGYDLIQLAFGPEKERQGNAIALGADLGGAALPCATGLGLIARGGLKVVKATEKAIDLNKLHHIFDGHGGRLAELVVRFGSREAAFRAVEGATQAIAKYIRVNEKGLFKEAIVHVGGITVKVSGWISDGIVHIGTFYE